MGGSRATSWAGLLEASNRTAKLRISYAPASTRVDPKCHREPRFATSCYSSAVISAPRGIDEQTGSLYSTKKPRQGTDAWQGFSKVPDGMPRV